jgi:hypothetical protein
MNWPWREKKSRRASEADPVERREFANRQATLPTPHLVFVDEFGINLAMTRSHARALRGQRGQSTQPFKQGSSLSVISALSLGGILAPMTIEGAVNGEVFDAYVEGFLVPALRPVT